MQKNPISLDEFQNFVENHAKNSRKILGFGIARVTLGQKNQAISATYSVLNWLENLRSYAVLDTAKKLADPVFVNENEEIFSITPEFLDEALRHFAPFLHEAITDTSTHKNTQSLLHLKKILHKKPKNIDFRVIFLYADTPCATVESAYMKLLALSLGKAPLRSLNLNGIFGLLPNLAWSGNTPYELNFLRENEIALKLDGKYPAIDFVDKFPRYLMHVIPLDNIRILDTAKTRFGAFLGSGGYTQMPGASYVNFNAGALGACMNEGRISSSVIIGNGTDIGGGASILGVLSGGNDEPITIGENCLLGVNSATGISLGNGCIVDGGCAVLAGMIFEIDDENARQILKINENFKIRSDGLYKGRDLSGLNGLHFRQDARTGRMIAMRSKREISLNAALH